MLMSITNSSLNKGKKDESPVEVPNVIIGAKCNKELVANVIRVPNVMRNWCHM